MIESQLIRRFLVFVLFLGCCGSCAEKVIEEPKGLIDPNTMTDILYDLAIVNALQASSPGTLSQWDLEIMEIIYARYDIDSTRFADSDAYYASLPVQYKSMYDSVQKRIDTLSSLIEEKRKQKNQKTLEEQKKKPRLDSIKKARERSAPKGISPTS